MYPAEAQILLLLLFVIIVVVVVTWRKCVLWPHFVCCYSMLRSLMTHTYKCLSFSLNVFNSALQFAMATLNASAIACTPYLPPGWKTRSPAAFLCIVIQPWVTHGLASLNVHFYLPLFQIRVHPDASAIAYSTSIWPPSRKLGPPVDFICIFWSLMMTHAQLCIGHL